MLNQQIAQALLSINAVSLRPHDMFTWTSGIKSPIYCDNRLTISYPEIRRQIAQGFAQLIQQHYGDAQVIAGTATAGIPHAAFVSEQLNLPMAYVRDSQKKHGKQNQIEGIIQAGQKVVIIEDLISTGMSSLRAAEAVQQAGAEVLAVIAIFSYRLEKAENAFKQANIPLLTLTDYDCLIDVALKNQVITQQDVAGLIQWRNQLSQA